LPEADLQINAIPSLYNWWIRGIAVVFFGRYNCCFAWIVFLFYDDRDWCFSRKLLSQLEVVNSFSGMKF